MQVIIASPFPLSHDASRFPLFLFVSSIDATTDGFIQRSSRSSLLISNYIILENIRRISARNITVSPIVPPYPTPRFPIFSPIRLTSPLRCRLILSTTIVTIDNINVVPPEKLNHQPKRIAKRRGLNRSQALLLMKPPTVLVLKKAVRSCICWDNHPLSSLGDLLHPCSTIQDKENALAFQWQFYNKNLSLLNFLIGGGFEEGK
ncbi:hypothetical protein E3N88_30266 [Mikania micrantha]|uniref:Uncharacterized protein n=1 Tax=Mikania micrantha TaxID=192012 RepID=A0A5N6MLK6_9ASTR|nr:hypothetical protein E3N88_30266 [Mikania micrantha]